MSPKTIHAIALVIFVLALSAFLQIPSNAQSQDDKPLQTWQSRLYESGVKYENFACSREDSKIVAAFFKEHPLRHILPICHNDCPVIRCRPVTPFPPIAKAARVTGTISVHVLVDEKGKVLSARELSGHPLLWAAARKGACETQFNVYPHNPHHKRQGVMHFTVDDYNFLSIPNTANQVL